MKKIKSFLCILIVLLATNAVAQYFTYGQDPASQKWRQLNTTHFKLIYPEIWENQARDLAMLLENVKQPLSHLSTSDGTRFPIILRNQTMVSNGFVTWAPRRMELFTIPPYDQQATQWMKYLAVHEYRHVAQVEAANVSLTRLFSDIFGEHITGMVVGMQLPLWFLEGDAVLTETSYTKTGRGRLPSFYMPLAAQLGDKGIYSFDKAMFGSYRDMVPNHYEMGYHLVAKIHQHYGYEPFRMALQEVGEIPFLPGPFSRGIKKTTGSTPAKHYVSGFKELQEHWSKAYADEPECTFSEVTNRQLHDYVNYHSPYYLKSGHLVAIRTSPSDIPRIITINSEGKEDVVFTPGYCYPASLSYGNGKVAWTEIRMDPRWGYRSFSNIRVLDLVSGENFNLTPNGRYQSPKLSPDGSNIVAVGVDFLNQWELVVMDVAHGQKSFSFYNPYIQFLTDPFWDDDNKTLYAIAAFDGQGKSLVRIAADGSGYKQLFDAGFADISKPSYHDRKIWFTGTWSGRDELYAWDIEGQQLFAAIATPLGANDATLSSDGSKVVFRNLTSAGYQLAEAQTDQLRKVETSTIIDKSPHLYQRAAEEAEFTVDELLLPDRTYKTSKYSKFLNLFHFHSWWPLSVNVEDGIAMPGISFLSQDLLGSTTMTLGAELDPTINGAKVYADLSLRALYPVFRLRAETGSEDRTYRLPDESFAQARTRVNKLTGSIGLPLSYNRNAFIYGISPRISTSFEKSNFTINNRAYTRTIQSFSYQSVLYFYRRMALRDMQPQLGIVFSGGFSHTPLAFQNAEKLISRGTIIYSEASLFLPGFFKHHSFRIYAGIQERNNGLTSFSNAIRFARGHESKQFLGLQTVSASYSLPLWYPDLAVSPIVYVKRVKANAFFDWSHSPVVSGPTIWSSAGLDIVADMHWFRMPMPFEMGIRTLYRINDGSIGVELISGVDFYAVGRIFGLENKMYPKY